MFYEGGEKIAFSVGKSATNGWEYMPDGGCTLSGLWA
jgi:hypothetical protein